MWSLAGLLPIFVRVGNPFPAGTCSFHWKRYSLVEQGVCAQGGIWDMEIGRWLYREMMDSSWECMAGCQPTWISHSSSLIEQRSPTFFRGWDSMNLVREWEVEDFRGGKQSTRASPNLQGSLEELVFSVPVWSLEEQQVSTRVLGLLTRRLGNYTVDSVQKHENGRSLEGWQPTWTSPSLGLW